ncbi:MAG: cysteine desulfurase [Candidatus Bathyarchaeota archaeon]|nr:cysteine desulfurase [Candidatus Bathyarchaeota archaeon]MDH5713482.1 cysteine desulfurase [Candidatus Bathyarchaeota archaeon]
MQDVRKDFPILETGIIYLDSAATSLTPEPVLQKMLEFYHQYRANVERGIHRLSQKASEEYERVRAKVADFINAKSESEIILTRNATAGINMIANGLNWKKGDKVVTSLIEHHSNFIVWIRLKNRNGVGLEIIKPREPMNRGILDPADFEKVIDNRTKLVTVTHVSNVIGVITPIKEITEIAHEHGAYVLVDAAQSIPHMKVDVQKIGCDFLTFSGHKMCAPTGSGALYVREDLIERLEPMCIGGGSIADVGLNDYKLVEGPMRFEAGTPGIGEAIGLGAAIDYLRKIGMENVESYERVLTRRMFEGLKDISKLEIYGPEPEGKVGIMTFNVGDLNPHDVALALDVSADIMVRSGHHCALPLTKNIIRKPGSVRASVYIYNTKEEIDKLVSSVGEIAEAIAN